MRRLRLPVLAALVLLVLPLAFGGTGLACDDDCADASCGDCLQCPVAAVATVAAPTGIPLPTARPFDARPDAARACAPARPIEHVPLA